MRVGKDMLEPRSEENAPLLTTKTNELDEKMILRCLKSQIHAQKNYSALQKLLGYVGILSGSISFAFSAVLGYQLGVSVNTSDEVKMTLGILLSLSTYIPLAILSSMHSKDVFELLPNLLLSKEKNPIEKNTSKLKKHLYFFSIIILGVLAAADSTELTRIYLGHWVTKYGVIPFMIITQLSMTILRSWSLDNMIDFSLYPFRKYFELFATPSYSRTTIINKYQILNKLAESKQWIENLPAQVVREVSEIMRKERNDVIKFIQLMLNIKELPPVKGYKDKISINEKDYFKSAICTLSGIIGLIAINGFIPPALGIGKVLLSTFKNNNAIAENILGYCFATGIVMCFGSLTMWASYTTTKTFYDWCKTQLGVKKSFSATPFISCRILVNVLSLLMSAGSALQATKLAIDVNYQNIYLRDFMVISAFIGLTLTDYYPMDAFNNYVFSNFDKEGDDCRNLVGSVENITNTISSLNCKSSIFLQNKLLEQNKKIQEELVGCNNGGGGIEENNTLLQNMT